MIKKTTDSNDLLDAFNKYNTDRKSVLVDDNYHSPKHRKPKFKANGTFVRWHNGHHQVKGYRWDGTVLRFFI